MIYPFMIITLDCIAVLRYKSNQPLTEQLNIFPDDCGDCDVLAVEDPAGC